MSDRRKKCKVMRRYDLTARMYDLRYADEQTDKIRAAMKHVTMERHERVLDAGCGTGVLFDCVSDKTDLVGVDISKRMLVEAKRRVRDKKSATINLVQADVDKLPFDKNVFSKVFVITVLQNIPDPAETLNEIRRVGRRGTVFVVTGLKRIFSKRAFTQLLREAGLTVEAFEEDGLRCYVAVCTDPAF